MHPGTMHWDERDVTDHRWRLPHPAHCMYTRGWHRICLNKCQHVDFIDRNVSPSPTYATTRSSNSGGNIVFFFIVYLIFFEISWKTARVYSMGETPGCISHEGPDESSEYDLIDAMALADHALRAYGHCESPYNAD